MEIDPEKDRTSWNNVIDNRHFDVIRPYHHEDARSLDERRANSLVQETEWLKFRNLLIRSLAAIYYSIYKADNVGVVQSQKHNNNVSNGTEKRNMVVILGKLVNKLSQCGSYTFKPLKVSLK